MRNLIEVEGLVVVGDELRRVRMQRLLDHHQFKLGKSLWSGGVPLHLCCLWQEVLKVDLQGKHFTSLAFFLDRDLSHCEHL